MSKDICQSEIEQCPLVRVYIWNFFYNWEYILLRGIKSKIIFLMISRMEGKNTLFRQAVLLKSTT